MLAQGWMAAATAEALVRALYTIGRWASAFGEGGPAVLTFEQIEDPPALDPTQQAELNVAVQELPATAGINLANWNWKVVRQVISRRFGIVMILSSCLNWLHLLGLAFKRPKKRLFKAEAILEIPRSRWRTLYGDH